VLTWLSTHPRVRMGLLAGLVTGFGYLLGTRIIEGRNRRRQSIGYRTRTFGRKAAAFLATVPLISSLPMFQHRSLAQRATDILPKASIQKTLAKRMKHETRLPEHMPLEKERRQAMKALNRERKHAIDVLEKERKNVAKNIQKQRDHVAERLHR
jgi:hypothetical protein